MPIRTVKQYTDRGKIKDLVVRLGETIVPESEPSSSELRMKKLYEFAQICKDKKLQDAIGFITTDYIADKNAIPLSAYRLRQMVADIKSKSPGKIDALEKQFSECFAEPLDPEALDYLNKKHARVKTASVRKPPIFWRARKS
jgi:hypothetical protein